MMEKHSAALQHRDNCRRLPIDVECINQCRLSVISKCIELYPESLTEADYETKELPLHRSLQYESASVQVALLMIEQISSSIETSKDSW
jgi:hypothetical protein